MSLQPIICDHPLIQHKMALLRDKNTRSKDFRQIVSEIAMLICYEATRDLPLKDIEVDTPCGTAHCRIISGRNLAVIPILRAGLGMIDGVLNLDPTAKVGHVGLYRDHDTMHPVEYYSKFPDEMPQRDVIVLEPMLATGGSAVDCINLVKEKGAKSIKFMCICAAPEGVEVLQAAHPDVRIYCATLDEGLDEEGYIMPGLGDAGDRIFGTK